MTKDTRARVVVSIRPGMNGRIHIGVHQRFYCAKYTGLGFSTKIREVVCEHFGFTNYGSTYYV